VVIRIEDPERAAKEAEARLARTQEFDPTAVTAPPAAGSDHRGAPRPADLPTRGFAEEPTEPALDVRKELAEILQKRGEK
jgi:hypothetical protein